MFSKIGTVFSVLSMGVIASDSMQHKYRTLLAFRFAAFPVTLPSANVDRQPRYFRKITYFKNCMSMRKYRMALCRVHNFFTALPKAVLTSITLAFMLASSVEAQDVENYLDSDPGYLFWPGLESTIQLGYPMFSNHGQYWMQNPTLRKKSAEEGIPLRDLANAVSLYHALQSRNEEVFEQLLLAGADPNMAAIIPFYKAVNKGIYGQDLVEDYHVADPPLHVAAEIGWSVAAQRLISSGANIETTGRFGSTPLHLAVRARAPDIIQALIEAGANIEAKDHFNNTPLHLAAWRNTPDAIRALLDAGANFEAIGEDGETPLHVASWRNAPDAIRTLLDADANIEAKDDKDRTPLHVAAWANAPDAILALLEKNANIEAKAINYLTPLHFAAEANAADAITALLEGGADITAQMPFTGLTPLHFAVHANATDAIRVLLEAGASVTVWSITPMGNKEEVSACASDMDYITRRILRERCPPAP